MDKEIDFFESLCTGLREIALNAPDSGNTARFRKPGEQPLRFRTAPCAEVSIPVSEFLAMTGPSKTGQEKRRS